VTATEPVAVLGAGGTMGLPMARNLARAGMQVRAWNRSLAKARPLAEDGVVIAGTPAEAADGAGTVLTMLADTDAVLAAVDGDQGALSAPAPPGLWLQMSTIGESGTDRCAELARRHGIAFVDAPVLGTRQPAEEGKLVVLASGPRELREPLQPVFDAVGQRTMWVGEAGAGSRLKLVANCWVVMVPDAGRQGRGPGAGVGEAARPGPAGGGGGPAAAGPGRRRTRRQGLQRHVPDQRASPVTAGHPARWRAGREAVRAGRPSVAWPEAVSSRPRPQTLVTS
jgi:hypothetical protein